MGIAPAGGFWALPTRSSEYAQMWSLATPEMMVAPPARFAAGEVAPARVGSYVPMGQGHLNLLASLSGAQGATGGRREEERR